MYVLFLEKKTDPRPPHSKYPQNIKRKERKKTVKETKEKAFF
jgi:hypothetical protein